MKLKDKTIIITGANGGIGKALVSLLTDEGAKLNLIVRGVKKLNSLKIKMSFS